MNLEVCMKVKGAWGQFGKPEETFWDSTFGMNEKGGMNEQEFAKYIKKNLIRLYPDARDKPGKRVILKVDSGPGRMNYQLLAKMRAKGFYLYPCVPNTTAVTQETDQLYSLFKTIFRENLRKLTDDRLAEGKSVSFNAIVIGTLVFGGKDTVTGVNDYKDAYASAFSPERNLSAWAAVGAAPLTRKCLTSDKVIQNRDDDPLSEIYKRIEETNCNSCDLLSAKGYNRMKMKVRLNMKKASATAKPVTHGLRFLETGGGVLGCNDAFIAAHCHNRKIERAAKEKDKAAWKAAEDNERRKALSILETMESSDTNADPNSKPRIGVKELHVLLESYNIKKKEILQMKVKEMREQYN